MKYYNEAIASIKPDNIGGVCSIKFVPKDWILTDATLSIQKNKTLSAVVLKPTRNWLELLPLHDSTSFTEPQQNSSAGTLYAQSIVANVSGESELLNTLMNALPYVEVVVLVKDRMGNIKLVGNKSHGLTFSTQLATGMIGAEKNVYAVSFQGESAERAPLYPF